MTPPERLLVVKLADLGDVITAIPALRALRSTFPGLHLDVLTSSVGAAVLAGSDAVNELVVADRHLLDTPRALLKPGAWMSLLKLIRRLRAADYDAVVFMHHLTTRTGAAKWRLLASLLRPARTVGLDNGRGRFFDVRLADQGFAAVHEVEYALRLAGALGAGADDRCLRMTIPEPAQNRAGSLLHSLGRRRFAVVHPGSGAYSVARRWAPERFAAVADALADRYGLPVVVVGSAQDGVEALMGAAHGRHLNLAGQTDVMTLAGVLSRAALFVGGDSGVMHVATAVGAPLLALFGPTDPRAWGPWRPPECGSVPAAVLQGRCPYDGPCLYRGHSLGRREGCSGRDCLRDLTVDEVLERIDGLGVL